VPTLFTRRATSEILGVSISTVGRLIARGDLAAYRVGVQLRISADAIDRYLQTHTVEKEFNRDEPTANPSAATAGDAGHCTAGATVDARQRADATGSASDADAAATAGR
jgi:excisionase family DNA binding protein